MRILIVSTKPPWPPRDGGRLALWNTLVGLHAAGHQISLVAPADRFGGALDESLNFLSQVGRAQLIEVRSRGWVEMAFSSLRHGRSVTVSRHHHDAVGAAVARCIADWQPDVVHAEQLQAFAHTEAARDAGIPVVLRMQNVESSLWLQVARARWYAPALALEARRLRRDECRAMRDATAVVALSERDRIDLAAIAGSANIASIPPPFPPLLEAAAPVAGAPAVVLSGSAGWWPNQDAQRWFLAQVVPRLHAALPGTVIHLYGGDAVEQQGVVRHAAPREAIDSFPHHAIAALPLHVGSGIRIRMLEAWARGLPVVASSVAAAGLDVQSGNEFLRADSADEFVAAIRSIHSEPALRDALVANGRAYLRQRHDAVRQTLALVQTYRDAQARRR